MKRLSILLLACALAALPLPAGADTAPGAVRYAKSNLTEVYGYTPEEAEAFTFDYTQTGSQERVEYYSADHPAWIYELVYDNKTGQYAVTSTPFRVSGYAGYPGENAVRGGLRAARENGWFADMSAENRAAFLSWMEQWGVKASDTLREGLANGSLTGAQAVEAYFESCYGDPEGWPQALTEWRDAELAAYGWTAEDAGTAVVPAAVVYTEGIHRYEDKLKFKNRPVTVTEFAGEVPAELTDALSHPKLACWTCVCGAYITVPVTNSYDPVDAGLLVMEKAGERLLVSIQRASGTEAWTVQPVGEAALLSGRDLYVTYNAADNLYSLAYPVSATETEIFRVRPQDNEAYGLLCKLEDYRHVNAATGESVVIAAANGKLKAADEGEWYQITTTTAAGETTVEQATALVPPYLEFLDADAFPKTAEACRADAGYILPENCAVTCGAHLRAKTSSHSADLGLYYHGTLMEMLGEEPGDPYPWYHVRIGSAEGYMADIYVEYPGSDCVMKPLQKYPPLPVAKTRKNIDLKKSATLFDATVAALPAGTKMHVLAECGRWLHVMVPQNGEPGWLMDPNGTDGYVKAADVLTAATALQLDWLE